ncbi:hypothetical protein QL285_048833 [Trifolium repens]|nr:hypothetical protein QL285_048833 [Trifolium repens]
MATFTGQGRSGNKSINRFNIEVETHSGSSTAQSSQNPLPCSITCGKSGGKTWLLHLLIVEHHWEIYDQEIVASISRWCSTKSRCSSHVLPLDLPTSNGTWHGF